MFAGSAVTDHNTQSYAGQKHVRMNSRREAKKSSYVGSHFIAGLADLLIPQKWR